MCRRIISLIMSLGLYLGLHNGHLAVFDSDRAEPLAVLPYSAALYTREDRLALQKGIRFDSCNELAQLLEDFLS